MSTQAQIEQARHFLVEVQASPNVMATLGAATLAATAAVLLAGVMILGPGVAIDDQPVPVSASL